MTGAGRRQAGAGRGAGRFVTLGLLLVVVAVATAQRGGGRRPNPREFAQFFGGSGDFYTPPDFAGNFPYDGRFTFARIKYRGYGKFNGREGPGWSHDYPDAELHLMRIVKEITSIRPFIESGRMIGSVIVALDEPLLYKYPVAYLSEPGGWFPNDVEAKGLREYLLKGGFLIVDDFDGGDWGPWEAGFAKAMPGLRPVELTGKEAIWDSFYKIDLNLVRDGGYGRRVFVGYYEDNDPKKRLLAIVNYNSDIGEAWQWSGTGWMPVDISNESYKLGVNYLVYALTH